jgi:hypothetical protein
VTRVYHNILKAASKIDDKYKVNVFFFLFFSHQKISARTQRDIPVALNLESWKYNVISRIKLCRKIKEHQHSVLSKF